jgi:hypothetical protein
LQFSLLLIFLAQPLFQPQYVHLLIFSFLLLSLRQYALIPVFSIQPLFLQLFFALLAFSTLQPSMLPIALVPKSCLIFPFQQQSFVPPILTSPCLNLPAH